MEVCKKFGKKVAELRKQKGFSQEKLGLEADVDRSQISKIERGACNTKLQSIAKISMALDVKISELFD